jgi:hypothetical protein
MHAGTSSRPSKCQITVAASFVFLSACVLQLLPTKCCWGLWVMLQPPRQQQQQCYTLHCAKP